MESIAVEERLYLKRTRKDIQCLREQLRELAALRCVNQKHSFSSRETQPGCRTAIFPGHCKNAFSLRRFLKEETQHVLDTCTPANRRRQLVERLLIHSAVPQVERCKTMSAMYRDLRSRASAREEDSSASKQTTLQVQDPLVRLRLHLQNKGLSQGRKTIAVEQVTLPQVMRKK